MRFTRRARHFLRDELPAPPLQRDEIGERPADVDAYA
jgi:hypothetical protein